MRILLVEDDPLTGAILAATLREHHYRVDVAEDGRTGLDFARTYEYDLVLLDVVLPSLDGISLCLQLRSQGFQEPIVLLTARGSDTDQIVGLDAGADDYIIKPFNLETLMARIRSLLRRKKASLLSTLNWENLQLNLNNCEVTCQGEPIRLTAKEYSLLELFLVNPKRIFSRQAILERLWDTIDSPGEETVSTHIKCLRQKLRRAGVPDPIETIYGLGYRLKSSSGQQKALDLTSKAWKKFKESYLQKLDILEQAAHDLMEKSLTVEIKNKAQNEAHKLAGSLGIFGMDRGSKIAKKIETIIEDNQKISEGQYQQILDWLTLLKREIEPIAKNYATASTRPDYSPLILLVDGTPSLAEKLEMEAPGWNLRVEIARDLTAARRRIDRSAPDLVLLELDSGDDPGERFTFLEGLSRSGRNLPVAILTVREGLSDRVRVARLGARAFLSRSLPVHEILRALTELFHQVRLSANHRIMIVDDDPLILTTLVELLKPWGVTAITLTRSEEFWQVLTSTAPDLLVLDVEMPGYNGLELCQVIRHDPKWQHLPILFFSIHTQEEIIRQMFAAGADDYMSKSGGYPELVNRIIRRLRKSC